MTHPRFYLWGALCTLLLVLVWLFLFPRSSSTDGPKQGQSPQIRALPPDPSTAETMLPQVVASAPEEASARLGVPPGMRPSARINLQGQVVERLNRAPIIGAAVRCWTNQAVGKPAMATTAETLEHGFFSLSVFSASEPVIEIDAADHAPYVRRLLIPSWSDLVLSAEDIDYDVGMVRLDKGVQVSGRIINEDRAAIDGIVPIFIIGGEARYGAPETRHVGTSQPNGTFQLSRTVAIEADDAFLLAVTDFNLGWARLADITLASEQKGELNIIVEKGGVIDLAVCDTNGVPIGGVKATLHPEYYPLSAFELAVNPAIVGCVELEQRFTRTADSRGRIQFIAVPLSRGKRRYSVHFSRSGFMPADLAGVEAVNPGTSEQATVVLGTIPTIELLSGVISSLDRVSLPGALVTCNETLKAVAGPHGQFTFAQVPAPYGEFVVKAQAQGYCQAVRRIMYDTKSSSSIDAGLIMLEQASVVDGVVVDQYAEPVSGVKLTLQPRENGKWESDSRIDSTMSGKDGRFTFNAVPLGRSYLLRANGPGLGTRFGPDTPRLVRGGERDLNVVRQRVADTLGRITATLSDPNSNEKPSCVGAALLRSDAVQGGPVQAAVINIAPESIYRSGARVIVDDVPIGEWCLWTLSVDNLLGLSCVTITPGDRDITTNIAVVPTASVGGTLVVSDLVHVAIDRLQVSVQKRGCLRVPRGEIWRQANVRTRASAEVSSNGEFMFDRLAPGIYELSVTGQGFSGHAELDLSSGGLHTTALEAHKGASIKLIASKFPLSTSLVIRMREGAEPWQEFTVTPLVGRVSEHVFEVKPGPVTFQVFLAHADYSHSKDTLLRKENWDSVTGDSTNVIVSPSR